VNRSPELNFLILPQQYNAGQATGLCDSYLFNHSNWAICTGALWQKKNKNAVSDKKDGYFKETEIRDAEFTDVKDEDE